MLYKAFISYSHAADRKLAPALQFGLHHFAKPIFRLRAMHVFRDETNLSNSPHLWSSIEQCLAKAEYFLLLASPKAASSPWVEKEIHYWLSVRSVETLLIILTEGEIEWDSTVGDFSWQKTTSLPRTLAGRYLELPRFTDLSWARNVNDLSLTNPRFKSAVADIAATLHGRPKDELVGADVEQHRRVRWIVLSTISALTFLTVVSVTTAAVLHWLYSNELTPMHLWGRIQAACCNYHIEPQMIRIEPGCFRMGTELAEPEERPVHDMCIGVAFEIGRAEVTFAEYSRFAYATGRKLPDDETWGTDSRPIINVSWRDADAYASWLSDKSRKRYRLPSEAEWEYAARAGTSTLRFWGDELDIGCEYANVSDRAAAKAGAAVDKASATFPCDDSFPNTAPVMEGRKPNQWGLYDMLGNVWEWVQDCYHSDYSHSPHDGGLWLEGNCELRVLRGGAWNYGPASVHSANRVGNRPGLRINTLGFRLARDLPQREAGS